MQLKAITCIVVNKQQSITKPPPSPTITNTSTVVVVVHCVSKKRANFEMV